MFLTLIVLLNAAAPAAPDFARISERDFEDLESCYGSFQGATAVLPKLKSEMPSDDYAAVAHAMDNLAASSCTRPVAMGESGESNACLLVR